MVSPSQALLLPGEATSLFLFHSVLQYVPQFLQQSHLLCFFLCASKNKTCAPQNKTLWTSEGISQLLSHNCPFYLLCSSSSVFSVATDSSLMLRPWIAVLSWSLSSTRWAHQVFLPASPKAANLQCLLSSFSSTYIFYSNVLMWVATVKWQSPSSSFMQASPEPIAEHEFVSTWKIGLSILHWQSLLS